MLCRKCKVEKSEQFFSWKIKAKRLRQSICKDCAAADERWYRAQHRTRIISESRHYYSEKREKLLKQKREYYLKNRGKILQKNHERYLKIKDTPEFKQHIRRYALKVKFGITIEDYNKLFQIQHGLCAICGQDGRLVVDHCHTTGKVRGLLCCPCNSFLGRIRENLTHLQKYLSR